MMKQNEIAAFHEAGHALIAQYFGYTVTKMIVHPDDGTGYTEAGPLIFNLYHQLDFSLGGPVAEDIISSRIQIPDPDDISWIVGMNSLGDDCEEDECDDYEDAVSAIVNRIPEITEGLVIREIQSSYLRCLQVLQRHWQVVETLAAEAIKALGQTVPYNTLLEIWDAAKNEMDEESK